jgi:hypothetical protein
MVSSTAVPDASLLGAYARMGAYTDCYVTSVAGSVTLAEFVFAFYTTPLFKVERWLLSKVLKIASTDPQASELADSRVQRFSAWKVEGRSAVEILLAAGQTRSWLSIQPQIGADLSTTLLFGSAVVPRRTDGKFGFAFHALGGFHRLYSKFLLAAASRRVMALRKAQSGV